MAQATIWTVSDMDFQNFPADESELNKRLAVVKSGIPNQGDNIKTFVKPAFELFKDCGFIRKILVENLSNKDWCYSWFKCTMNPMPGGGVLRRKGETMWSSSNLRYYCPYSELTVFSDIESANKKNWKSETKLAVICEGETYYISNNWFDDGNRKQKEKFYWWISEMARQHSKVRWEQKFGG